MNTPQSEEEVLSSNVIMTEMALDMFINQTVSHLEETKAQCVRACIGQDAAHAVEALEPELLLMLAIIALRRLAEQQYESQDRVDEDRVDEPGT